MTGTYAEQLDAASEAALAAGMRVLQGNRLGGTDEAHVAELLARMRPDHGDLIVDIGSGFGEVARLMHEARPDLRFHLVNSSFFQMGHAPQASWALRHVADMHAMPLESGSADGCMFLYSLCHADMPRALAEAARVTMLGGWLFIYDYARQGGDNAEMARVLHAQAVEPWRLERMARQAGWELRDARAAPGDDRGFRRLFDNDVLYDSIFETLRPMTWRFRRVSE